MKRLMMIALVLIVGLGLVGCSSKKEDLVGPLWSLKKWEVLNAIDDTMKARNSFQGIKYVAPEK